MNRYTTPSWKRFPFEILVLAVLMLAMTVFDPRNSALGYVGFSSLLLCYCLSVVRAWLIGDEHQLELERAVDDAIMNHSTDDVDIWKYQAELMAISGQIMPSRPTLHNGVLLYAALNAEELGETFSALAIAVASANQGYLDEVAVPLDRIAMYLGHMGSELAANAVYIRNNVADLPTGFSADFTKAEAVELLDGVTDVAVVLAGLGLAAGLPVRDGYQDVGVSNLSKANPVTGVIDKDPGGKWIKGSQYHKPNLEAVLAKHYAPGV